MARVDAYQCRYQCSKMIKLRPMCVNPKHTITSWITKNTARVFIIAARYASSYLPSYKSCSDNIVKVLRRKINTRPISSTKKKNIYMRPNWAKIGYSELKRMIFLMAVMSTNVGFDTQKRKMAPNVSQSHTNHYFRNYSKISRGFSSSRQSIPVQN